MIEIDEILKVFATEKVDLDDMPADDPMATFGRRCEELFTGGVEALRKTVPNERIRALASVVWDLIGHKRVLVVIGSEVPALTFTVMRQNVVDQGLVLIPKNWPQMVESDPLMQLGAILFIGAQVVDFYNDQILGDLSSARTRWEAYEAELLRTLKQILPNWTPNAFHHEVLQRYPDGLDTAGVDLYPIKAYEPAQGNA